MHARLRHFNQAGARCLRSAGGGGRSNAVKATGREPYAMQTLLDNIEQLKNLVSGCVHSDEDACRVALAAFATTRHPGSLAVSSRTCPSCLPGGKRLSRGPHVACLPPSPDVGAVDRGSENGGAARTPGASGLAPS